MCHVLSSLIMKGQQHHYRFLPYVSLQRSLSTKSWLVGWFGSRNEKVLNLMQDFQPVSCKITHFSQGYQHSSFVLVALCYSFVLIYFYVRQVCLPTCPFFKKEDYYSDSLCLSQGPTKLFLMPKPKQQLKTKLKVSED